MIFDKVKDLVVEVLSADADALSLTTDISADLGADSLDIASIIMGIEDEYDVKVDTEVASKVTTVGEALALIKGASEG